MFTGESMMIGFFDGKTQPRLAQSSTSSAFHFRSRLCATCNSARTQPADLEFAHFDEIARRSLEEGSDPGDVFDEPRYAQGGAEYLNVFRYPAKALACQIAEVGGPRFLALTNFAIGRTDVNPVRLGLDADPTYPVWHEGSGETAFAGHGGLGIEVSRKTGLVEVLRSTLTHGPLRYSFSIGFSWPIGRALQLLHPDFHAKCEVAYQEALSRS
jgi:hypothetical protein